MLLKASERMVRFNLISLKYLKKNFGNPIAVYYL